MSVLAKRSREATALAAMLLAGNAAGMLAGAALAGDAQARTTAVSLPGATTVSDRALASWVEQRVQDWQLKVGERRFDEIGWAKTLRDAGRLAKQHGRPIFLFTYDGHMAIGRC